MFLNRRVLQALARNRLQAAKFTQAVEAAMAATGSSEPPAQRVLLCAAKCYQPGGTHVDFGGGLSLYPLILAQLGMDVTVADLYAGQEPSRMAVFSAHGVTLIEADLYAVEMAAGSLDGVSMFETIEHLPHSPKPILDTMVAALKPGGRFLLSVPNICRIENRFRMLTGRNPMGKYRILFDSGERFLGHHREMTIAEVAWLPSQLGLEVDRVYTTDLRYKERPNAVKSAFSRLANHYLLNDLMPATWRRQIWLEAHRPG
jgi:2-polyprenyl-3-methyl-5-hydroxy-6-metoxy-1,4-benzoquinol methylase